MIPFKKINPSISIIGCGWYGFQLAKTLVGLSYVVKGSTTTPAKLLHLAEAGIKPYLLNFESGKENTTTDFFESEMLIICIPPKRNSDEVKQYAEKIEKISVLASSNKIENIIFISATSVYGDFNTTVDELSTPTPQTESGRQILKAEQILKNNSTFITTIIRFSGLVGPGRNPGRFFSGKKDIPNGKAPINLIHLQDCIGLTLEIINLDAFGYTYNASAPHHPEKQVFYKAAAKSAGFEEPEFIDELKEWKIISSIQVPMLLNYTYIIDNWLEWLKDSPK